MARTIQQYGGSYTFDASAKTIVFNNLPFTIQLHDIALITNLTDGLIIYNFADPSAGGTLSGTTLTLEYNTTSMDDSDILQILINVNDIGDDYTTDTRKVSTQNPTPSYYVDVVPLISAAQNLTASFADLGFEISTQGYSNCRLYLTLDINDSLDTRIKVLGKHTSAGSEEYELDSSLVEIQTLSRYYDSRDGSLARYFEIERDVDHLFIVDVSVDNSIAYLQVQVSAGTAGATPGQIDAAYYQLGYGTSNNSNKNFRQQMQCLTTGSMKMIDYPHNEIHAGDHYFYTDYDSDVDISAPKYYRLTTPNTTKRIHMILELYSEGLGTRQLFENPTVNAAGTTATTFNNNRNSSNTAGLVVAFDPTSTADGTLIGTWRTGQSSGGANRGPSMNRNDNEIILKQNEDYFLKFTADADNSKVKLGLDRYEHTNR